MAALIIAGAEVIVIAGRICGLERIQAPARIAVAGSVGQVAIVRSRVADDIYTGVECAATRSRVTAPAARCVLQVIEAIAGSGIADAAPLEFGRTGIRAGVGIGTRLRRAVTGSVAITLVGYRAQIAIAAGAA